MKYQETRGTVPPEIESGRVKPISGSSGRDETPGQAVLRLVMMMLGSAGLAADRSLFWTILASYAKKDKGEQTAVADFSKPN